jgi:hypothetical protein
MTDNLITPPPELVQRWINEENGVFAEHIATQAARWGSDQELEACCEFMQHEDFHGFARELRAARRPKPPTLKEQALGALYAITSGADDAKEFYEDVKTLKAALEQLPDTH